MRTKNGRIVDEKYNSKNYPRLYHIWAEAKYRCQNPKASNYQYYGAKGIDFCEEWDKFAPFCKWALDNGYEESFTLDRVDNSKGYSPDNCRWVGLLEQTNNRNTNAFYEYNGETHTLAEWSRIYDLNYDTLLSRYATGIRGAELFHPSRGKKKDRRFDNVKYSDKTLMSWNKKKLILYIKKLYEKSEIAEQMKEVRE